jgi:hypothetical protein
VPEIAKPADNVVSIKTGENLNPIGNAWQSANEEDRFEFVYLWKSDIDAIVGPISKPNLREVWDQSNEEERSQFLLTLRYKNGKSVFQANENCVPEIATGTSKPEPVEPQSNVVPIRPPPTLSAPPEEVEELVSAVSEPVNEPVREYVSEPADDDDEPADWWKELTGEK